MQLEYVLIFLFFIFFNYTSSFIHKPLSLNEIPEIKCTYFFSQCNSQLNETGLNDWNTHLYQTQQHYFQSQTPVIQDNPSSCSEVW